MAYRLGGRRANSVLAAAALAHLLAEERGEPEKLLVLVPETLFQENHCSMYRLLLEAKTGYQGRRLLKHLRGRREDVTRPDPLAHMLLEKGPGCITVPHPGTASPLTLAETGEGYLVEYSDQRRYTAAFESMINTVYAALRSLAGSGLDIVLDLTHGTNPLVSSTLLSSAMIGAVYGQQGVETRVYMAPVLGRPGEDTEVEFIDMTPALEAVNTVAAGINAWMMLDERLLPWKAIEDRRSRLGSRYHGRYGRVKKLVSVSAGLLWALRSGQVPLAPPRLRELKSLQEEAEKSLAEMLSDHDALAAPEPWVPVADTALVSAKRLVDALLKPRNDDTMIAAIEHLARSGMPDRALGPARELIVALILAREAEPGEAIRVGGQKWGEIDRLLNICSRQGHASENCARLPLGRGRLGSYDRARKLRNRLMHGRFSKDDNAAIYIRNDGDIEVVEASSGKTAHKPLEPITLEETMETVDELLEILRALRDTPSRSRDSKRSKSDA